MPYCVPPLMATVSRCSRGGAIGVPIRSTVTVTVDEPTADGQGRTVVRTPWMRIRPSTSRSAGGSGAESTNDRRHEDPTGWRPVADSLPQKPDRPTVSRVTGRGGWQEPIGWTS